MDGGDRARPRSTHAGSGGRAARLVTVQQAMNLGADRASLRYRVDRGDWFDSATACCDSRARRARGGNGCWPRSSPRGPRRWRRGRRPHDCEGSTATRTGRSAGEDSHGELSLACRGEVHRSGLLLPHHVSTVEPIPCTRRSARQFDLLHGLPLAAPATARRLPLGAAVHAGAVRRARCEIGGRGVSPHRHRARLLDERGDGYVPPESEGSAHLGSARGGRAACARSAGPPPFPQRLREVRPRRLLLPRRATRDRSRQPALALVVLRVAAIIGYVKPIDGRRLARPGVTWWQLKRRPREGRDPRAPRVAVRPPVPDLRLARVSRSAIGVL